MRFGGGMGGGMMMGGVRGLQSDGFRAANLEGLSDEGITGAAYDHRVVTRLLRYVHDKKLNIGIAIAGVLVYVAANVTLPLLLFIGIDRFVNDGDTRGVHTMGAVFIGVVVIHFLSNYVQFAFMPKVGQGILYDLRNQMFRNLQRLSPSFFHRTAVGRIMSRNTSDLIQIQEAFELFVQSLADMLSLVGILVIMMFIDWQLTLICMAMLPVLVGLLFYWQRFAKKSFMRIRRAIAMVNGEYNQNISGIRVVESLNRQDRNLRHFDALNGEYLAANMEASRFSGALNPMVEVLMGFAIGVVIVLGGERVLGGSLDWAIMLTFTMYIQRSVEPVRHLAMQYSQLQRAMAAGVRIFEIIDLKPEVKDADNAEEMPPIVGRVQYEHVNFHYVPGIEVLKDVNLDIEAGETVALVGATGAGKSTFVTLLLRFADVTGGSIKIDGYDLKTVKRQSAVSQMSMVLQEPYLFTGTVMENIRYSHEEVSDADVEAAAKAVGAHDFVMGLENGYQTMLAERGINLSVGQRQLLSFARAIVGDPKVLILDEATANIDTQTELLIQSALRQVLQGRTSLVIAHRLSTIRNADKIVVLDLGEVVEVGSHDELLAKGGTYARLYAINYGLEVSSPEGEAAKIHAGDDD